MSEPVEPTWLNLTQARMLHAETINLFGGALGIRDKGLLQSALGRPQNHYAYGEAPSIYELAAAYGYGIARNHPFIDGNKRTTLLAIRAFLFRNGYRFDPDQVETVTVMEGVAAGSVTEEEIAAWIEENATPKDTP